MRRPSDTKVLATDGLSFTAAHHACTNSRLALLTLLSDCTTLFAPSSELQTSLDSVPLSEAGNGTMSTHVAGRVCYALV